MLTSKENGCFIQHFEYLLLISDRLETMCVHRLVFARRLHTLQTFSACFTVRDDIFMLQRH